MAYFSKTLLPLMVCLHHFGLYSLWSSMESLRTVASINLNFFWKVSADLISYVILVKKGVNIIRHGWMEDKVQPVLFAIAVSVFLYFNITKYLTATYNVFDTKFFFITQCRLSILSA